MIGGGLEGVQLIGRCHVSMRGIFSQGSERPNGISPLRGERNHGGTGTHDERRLRTGLSWAKCCGPCRGQIRHSVARFEDGHEGFLGDFDAADLFHAFFAGFLFFQKLAFSADVAAVAFAGDVLAQGGDGFAGDDAGADGGLEGDFEEVAVDFFLEFFDDGAAALFGFAAVDDEGEGGDFVAGDEDVHFDEVVFVEADEVVVEGAVALGAGFEAVEEIEDDFGEGHFVFEHAAVGGDEVGFHIDAAAVDAELGDVADAVGGKDNVGLDHGLADGGELGGVGEFGGGVDGDDFSVGHDDFVGNGGGGLDDFDFVFAFEAFLHDFHVQKAEESAAEAEA